MSDERWLERLAALVFRFIGLAMVLQGSIATMMLVYGAIGGRFALIGGAVLFVFEVVVGVLVFRSSRRLGEFICQGL